MATRDITVREQTAAFDNAERVPIGTRGGIEGASRMSRELANWPISFGTPDNILNPVKTLVDARSSDTAQNDPWAQSALSTHRDAIVGARFALNAKPDYRTLGMTTTSVGAWADDFQEIVEARFAAVAESEDCWLDAARRRTLTEMCRQAVVSAGVHGEILAPAEWLRDVDRPCRTAVHLVSPLRLSNPNNSIDLPYSGELGYGLSRGIKKDYYGRHLSYFVQPALPMDLLSRNAYRWNEVPAQLPWGRKQMAFINEPLLLEQTRGVGDMVVALPVMRMGAKHGQLALQNAVINAIHAAVIESSLPPEQLAAAMGALPGNGSLTAPEQLIDGWEQMVGTCMTMMASFMSGAQNLRQDGAQVVALPPGASLKLLNGGNGGVGFADFQRTVNQKAARALGLSYEEYSGDYSQTNYSSAKASGAKTERFMNARKKFTADRLASYAFTLWLEEELANPDSPIPLPPTWTDRSDFYRPLQKAAICRADWIGTGSGQIDELKETQAAILRIRSGLSTWERECAKLGIDWREMAQQQSRESKLFLALALSFTQDAQKPANTLQDTNKNLDPASDPTGGTQ